MGEYRKSSSKRSVIVVGAGPGGLAAAMLLAQRGISVQVFEKQDVIGGRNAELRLGEYSFDLGPTFLMMKFLLDELFAEGGRRSSDYLAFKKLDPMYALKFPDKTMLVRSQPDAMKAEIEKHFPGDGANLDRFLARESLRFAKLYPCLQKQYGTVASMMSPTLLAAAPHIAAGQSLYSVLGDYFRSEELRLAFTFQSKYLGMSPWDCPGLFAMIPYTEHAHGVYHVMGGLSRISHALADVAASEGAEIHTSSPVARVLLEGRRVVGVELTTGEKVFADDVVINADFGHAMATLFDERALGRHKPAKLRKRKFSCSTFMMYLGLNRTYDAEHHTIVFARDYKRNIEAISRGQASFDDLSVYVRNSSKVDPYVAPSGHSALYILAPVPNNISGIDWDEYKIEMRTQVLRTIRERTEYGDLAPYIQRELIITPRDWERKHSVFLGATFNMAHSWDQMLYLRPHNEFEEFSNCYLVGGGTHPGSGLPTIFESARISANLICKKYEVPHPTAKPLEVVLA
ncbi:phytoene desaturase family protein [Occallatibacter riparius]|uniref:Phytoene desaturase family protein n=1 Tax=Occallatibacter riparius TaxID=1002689 RepID=A0A9J7BFZ1_9BACT|nr:phytoene desaturase family protein [Occallatibacter riparius]UWZ81679.1 phytoene desaturase family protein [Occallatibacter riparius]